MNIEDYSVIVKSNKKDCESILKTLLDEEIISLSTYNRLIVNLKEDNQIQFVNILGQYNGKKIKIDGVDYLIKFEKN